MLIFAAIDTFTGVTTGRAYDRGRAYNHVLAEAARQDALGWTDGVTLSAGVLRVVVRDREGNPVAGRLEGVLRRPVEGTELPFAPAVRGARRMAASRPSSAPGNGRHGCG